MRNNNVSFRIAEIPREKKFIVCYSRGGSWNHYQERGKFVQHDSWAAAFEWLVERNGKNVTHVLMHFCGTLPSQPIHTRYGQVSGRNSIVEVKTVDQKQPGGDAPTLFDFLTDAHTHNKDSLEPQQMFYFLRGVLFQWCVEHGESVMDMEEFFITDIRCLANQK